MTKKDYQKFADMLATFYNTWDNNSLLARVVVTHLEDRIVEIFKADNPRFDETKFWKAIAKGRK